MLTPDYTHNNEINLVSFHSVCQQRFWVTHKYKGKMEINASTLGCAFESNCG